MANQGENAVRSEGDWDWLDAIEGPMDADFIEASLDQPTVAAEADPVNFDAAPNEQE